MKEKILKCLMILIFIVGLGILLYPIISNFLMNKYQTTAIQNYNYTVEDMEKEITQQKMKEAVKYNEKFNNVVISDPFSTDAKEGIDSSYNDVLNIDGIMGYLEIPKIDVKLSIYHGTSEEVLEKGVGHIETTPLPIGGIGNHSILSAHRGLPSAKLFTDLDKMEIGDVFNIKILNEILYYKVDQIKIIEPTNTNDLQAEEGKDYITLLTCTPYGINSHRMLVRGERIDESVYLGSNIELKESEKKNKYLYIALIIIVIALIFYCIYKKKKEGSCE